jgi:hypothetical protein
LRGHLVGGAVAKLRRASWAGEGVGLVGEGLEQRAAELELAASCGR